MLKLQTKIVSSLEKCFWDDNIESKREINEFTIFKNERLSFQVAYRAENDDINMINDCVIRTSGTISDFATVKLVSNVLNMYPIYNVNPGGEFLRTRPGAYPDLIRPFVYPNTIALPNEQTNALWIDIGLPDDFAAGEYSFCLEFYVKGECVAKTEANIRVLEEKLPKQTLIHTEWIYTDCIANYYHTRPFSKRHWRLVENFIRVAAKNGVNMILTPVFTPELDTYIGGERLTTQLVDVELTEGGKYAFNFEKLHKWIDICLHAGIEYFEIPHFFSQWGAKATPKIVVKVGGKNRKYFGWHTDSMGEEYEVFLSQFLPALITEFKNRSLDKKCFFHVSDEPELEHLEGYKRCKEKIAKYLEGFPIIDAVSDFKFYETGVIDRPVPITMEAMRFVEAGVPNLWVYYCGGGRSGISDRSIAMPAERTRIIGVQLYYFGIEGFLHWGYNFYNSYNSYSALDPFQYPDCSYFTPSGDCFLVYPGTDGEAWESLRLNSLREAMDDIRALKWYEYKFGREATVKMLEEEAGGAFTFKEYPTGPDFITNIRDRIIAAAQA